MKYFITLGIILGFCFSCFAEQKAFYDNVTGKHIIDVSGNKPAEQIKNEFGLSNVTEISYDENNETTRIENGTLIKFNYKEENAKIKAEKDKEEKNKKDSVRAKLNLTEKDWQDLQDAIR